MASAGASARSASIDVQILKAGYLLKQGHVVKSWKERLFILNYDRLCYYDLPPGTDLVELRGPPLGVIRLADVTSVAATRNRCTFKVTVAANPASGQIERDYLLVTATDKEREEWLAALRRAIFSPGRAVDILRTAMDMHRESLLCSREIEQIKEWLKNGSDAAVGRAAALLSEAGARDPSSRGSDACESSLIDFKAARTEGELLRILAYLRKVIREEEEAGRAGTGGLGSGAAAGLPPSGAGSRTGGVPTESFRERLLEFAMEHIEASAMASMAAASDSAGAGAGAGSGTGTGSGAEQASGAGSSTPSAPTPTLAAEGLPQSVSPPPSSSPSSAPVASSSSWLPSFGGLLAGSNDTIKSQATLDRSNSRTSAFSRSDSSLRKSASGLPSLRSSGSSTGLSVVDGAGSSSSQATPVRWSPDVQEAFGLVLHQIAMRIAIAEEREGRKAQQAKETAASEASPPATAARSRVVSSASAAPAAGSASAPASPSLAPAALSSVDATAATEKAPVAPADATSMPAVPSTASAVAPDSGNSHSSAGASAPQPSDAVAATSMPNSESLDDLLERYGLADDLRRLHKARAGGTPRLRRSRGESGVTSRSGRAGTLGAAEDGAGPAQSPLSGRPSNGTPGPEDDRASRGSLGDRDDEDEDEEDEQYDGGPEEDEDGMVRAHTAAYLRGPTARARAATSASLRLSQGRGPGGKLQSALSVLSTARHSTKVAAAAAETAIAGPDASILRGSSADDPDPCAALRDEQPFSAVYRLGDRIGEGAYSIVYHGTHKATGEFVAVKIARKSAMTPVERRRLLEEVRIMSALDHDHIVRLQAFHEDEEAYYIVSELCTGGELFDKIVTRNTYSEREAREVVRTIAEAVAYMHAHGVVHRDLKPENILLSTSDDETAIIRIADMGFAKVVPRNSNLRTSCGTPSYVAPEILEGRPYGMAVDLWSLGVITYILLAGYAPFHARNQTELFRSIVAGRYYFDSPYWDGVSESAKDLIRRLLVVDPSKRLTAAQVLHHKWLHGTVSAVELTSAVQQLRISQSSRRAIMKRGELTKRGAIFWSWRRRMFVLTSETLEYFDSTEYAEGNNPTARPKGVISLKDVEAVSNVDGTAAAALQAPATKPSSTVTSPTGSAGGGFSSGASAPSTPVASDGPWLFTVRLGGGRQYILAADTDADRSEWVRTISSARAHSDLVRKALLAKEAHADQDLVALMKLAAAWKELVGLPEGAEGEAAGAPAAKQAGPAPAT